MTGDLERLRAKLSQGVGAILEAWMAGVAKESFALRGRPELAAQLRERCGVVLEALEEALRGGAPLALGGPELREPVERLAFTCGWLAGQGVPIGVALGLAFALADALGGLPETFRRGLAVLATEAHASGLKQALEARHRMVIEKSQVVCLLEEALPCLFLVGDPDRQALDEALGRLMMLVVMRDAQTVIIDASSLLAPEERLLEALAILADYASARAPRLMLSGVTPPTREALARIDLPPGTSLCEELTAAIEACREGSPTLERPR